MAKAKATTGQEFYKTEIYTGSNHLLIADESREDGSLDSGATPTELLASALASCSTITMKMYAKRKGWPVEEIQAVVEFKRNIKDSQTQFHKKISIKGNLTKEQVNRIYKIASKCPVHRILSGSIEINSELIN